MQNSLTKTYLPPKLLLVISRALAALGPSLIALLIMQASNFNRGGESPISFCNVLFVGNLCAALTVGTWFGWRAIFADLKSLKRKLLIGLVINGCLSTLLSALIFSGLMFTSVTNSILLARFGPVIYALAGALILGQNIKKLEWFGFSLIGVGIVAIVLKSNNFQINTGDILILASALVYASTALISKVVLAKECSLRIVVFTRNAISATVFFFIANILFGPHHFGDAFSGQLWIIMSVYALFVIVLAQFSWYAALEKLDSKTLGKWTVLSPVFGVTYALILNGERPSSIQVSAFVVIMTGLILSNLSIGKKMPQGMPDSAENSVSAS